MLDVPRSLPSFMSVNKTTPKWNLVAFSFLGLHKGPFKAGWKAGNFLGLYSQDGVCMKNKDADEKYYRLAKPDKNADCGLREKEDFERFFFFKLNSSCYIKRITKAMTPECET